MVLTKHEYDGIIKILKENIATLESEVKKYPKFTGIKTNLILRRQQLAKYIKDGWI